MQPGQGRFIQNQLAMIDVYKVKKQRSAPVNYDKSREVKKQQSALVNFEESSELKRQSSTLSTGQL